MHITMVHLGGELYRHPMCSTLIRYLIYIYCFSTRFLCQIMLVSFISNMTVSRLEHDMYAYLTRTPEFFNGFVLLNVFCIVIRRSLFFLLSVSFWPLYCLSSFQSRLLITLLLSLSFFYKIPISAINNGLLWITASDYPIAIFKFFVPNIYQCN